MHYGRCENGELHFKLLNSCMYPNTFDTPLFVTFSMTSYFNHFLLNG